MDKAFFVLQSEPPRLERIVARERFTRNPPTQHRDQDEVLAQSPALITIEGVNGGEHLPSVAAHSCLLNQLADRGFLDRLPTLDLATGKAPAPSDLL